MAAAALAATCAPPARVGTAGEEAAARAVYARTAAAGLSRDVLQRHPAHLAVLPGSGLGWNDLGDPVRVRATQESLATVLATG